MRRGRPDPIALFALQHWAYCPRRCELIHLEQAMDAQVDRPGFEIRRWLRFARTGLSAYTEPFDGHALAVGERLDAAPGVRLMRRC